MAISKVGDDANLFSGQYQMDFKFNGRAYNRRIIPNASAIVVEGNKLLVHSSEAGV
jgi:hypothetical protein